MYCQHIKIIRKGKVLKLWDVLKDCWEGEIWKMSLLLRKTAKSIRFKQVTNLQNEIPNTLLIVLGVVKAHSCTPLWISQKEIYFKLCTCGRKSSWVSRKWTLSYLLVFFHISIFVISRVLDYFRSYKLRFEWIRTSFRSSELLVNTCWPLGQHS